MNGFILLNKPSGMTSFAAAARLRRIFSEKRIGHTGTLDPMATGVLPILLGRSTRLCSMLMDTDKRYLARVRLGITTNTLDITGEIVNRRSIHATLSDIITVASSFLGDIYQLPPMYSALKKDGKRLYELAREGIEVERALRPVTIKEIEVSDFHGQEFTLVVRCSKGTYVRSLCHDIGEKLGCGAAMSALCRTETGGFDLCRCSTLEEIEQLPQNHLLPSQFAIPHIETVTITEPQKNRFLNGGELFVDRISSLKPDFCDGECFSVLCQEEFLGVGEIVVSKAAMKPKFIICET